MFFSCFRCWWIIKCCVIGRSGVKRLLHWICKGVCGKRWKLKQNQLSSKKKPVIYLAIKSITMNPKDSNPILFQFTFLYLTISFKLNRLTTVKNQLLFHHQASPTLERLNSNLGRRPTLQSCNCLHANFPQCTLFNPKSASSRRTKWEEN